MNPVKRGADPFSSKGQAPKHTATQLKKQASGQAKEVANSVGMKPGSGGYKKIKGAVSG